jgi:hypothetical protein
MNQSQGPQQPWQNQQGPQQGNYQQQPNPQQGNYQQQPNPQQGNYQQQPQGYYQPPQYPQQRPPKKKDRKLLKGIGIGFGVLILLSFFSNCMGGNDSSKQSNGTTTPNTTTVSTTKATSRETTVGTTRELTQEEINKQLVEDYQSNVKVCASNALEELYGKKIKFKLLDDRTVAVYSNDIVKTKDGIEIPYSFSITGKSETKTGDIISYMMCLGFKSEEDINRFNYVLLEYIDMRTGETVINVPEENSVIKTILDIAKNDSTSTAETITLVGEELGEYGREVVLNAKSDMPVSKFLYKIPAGKYQVTTDAKKVASFFVVKDEINNNGDEKYPEELIPVSEGYNLTASPEDYDEKLAVPEVIIEVQEDESIQVVGKDTLFFTPLQ